MNSNDRKYTKEEIQQIKLARQEQIAKEREAQKSFEKEIFKKAEIKRICEKLTKKEICNIYGFNYTFFMNSLSGRNRPSREIIESLQEYLNTPTQEIYTKVFLSREAETLFNKNLDISVDEFDKYIKENKENNTITITDNDIEVLRRTLDK